MPHFIIRDSRFEIYAYLRSSCKQTVYHRFQTLANRTHHSSHQGRGTLVKRKLFLGARLVRDSSLPWASKHRRSSTHRRAIGIDTFKPKALGSSQAIQLHQVTCDSLSDQMNAVAEKDFNLWERPFSHAYPTNTKPPTLNLRIVASGVNILRWNGWR